MRLLALCPALLLACGGAGGPPRGPDHTPADSPEAASECPVEWQAAKAAREAMLGDDSTSARSTTARAVLAQADCERVVLAAATFRPGLHQEIVDQVGALRREQQDTKNLYNEVAGYGVPAYRVAAIVGRGALSAAFSRRLREVPIGNDLSDVAEQSAFRAEAASLVAHFEDEAARELLDGLALSASTPGTEAARDLACSELAALGRSLPPTCPSGG